jgi:hypothetical protein
MTKKPLTRWPTSRDYERTPHPPGGRCMPNRCYCGQCASYVPLSSTRDIAADFFKADKRMADSWANRDGDTWIDKV